MNVETHMAVRHEFVRLHPGVHLLEGQRGFVLETDQSTVESLHQELHEEEECDHTLEDLGSNS